MKYSPIIFLFILFSSFSYGQSNERYKIIVVDKLEPSDFHTAGSKTISHVQFNQPNDEKSILMLDTQTGRTWIMTKITLEESFTSEFRKVEDKTLVWQEILYLPLSNSSRTIENEKLQKELLITSPSNENTKTTK